VTVLPDPERAKRAGVGILVEPVDGTPDVTAGVPARVRFRMTDRATGDPAEGLEDVTVLALSPGGWQRRLRADPEGAGIYAIEWSAPRPGVYYLYAESPSAGVRLNRSWFLTIDAKEADR
jgi:hypothetical protein